jgi:hypothetical protein
VPKSSEKSSRPTDTDEIRGLKPKNAPRTAPSNRVNIAFPFSEIKLEEPSKELAELAALVCDLVATMAEWVPEDRLEELRTRAQGLRDSLR